MPGDRDCLPSQESVVACYRKTSRPHGERALRHRRCTLKPAAMSNDKTRQHLLGTWKLIAAVREEIPSGIKTEFLGSKPVGYINYGADGRMLVLSPQAPKRRLRRWKRCFAA
jgi:hypothetical protein